MKPIPFWLELNIVMIVGLVIGYIAGRICEYYIFR